MMRRFIQVVTIALMACTQIAQAQDSNYPNRPITWIVPMGPGGTSDVFARTIQPFITNYLGQPMIVENKSGAAGTIAADFVSKSTPDGYTLLAGNNNTNSLMPLLNAAKLKYDIIEKLIPIIYVNHVPAIFAAASSVPNTLTGFVD
jgi:tripartite-type tricarboxylate transporter receptor subunit TctC